MISPYGSSEIQKRLKRPQKTPVEPVIESAKPSADSTSHVRSANKKNKLTGGFRMNIDDEFLD